MRSLPRERLRALRIGLGLSLAAFAERIGCAASSLSMIESGSRMPGLHVALGIKREAGIDPEEWANPERKRRGGRAA